MNFLELPIGTSLKDSDGDTHEIIGHHNGTVVTALETCFERDPVFRAFNTAGRLLNGDNYWLLEPKPDWVDCLEKLRDHDNHIARDLILHNISRGETDKITMIKTIRALTESGLTGAKQAYERMFAEANRYSWRSPHLIAAALARFSDA